MLEIEDRAIGLIELRGLSSIEGMDICLLPRFLHFEGSAFEHRATRTPSCEAIQSNTMTNNAMLCKERQANAKQRNAMHCKAMERNAQLSNARQRKKATSFWVALGSFDAVCDCSDFAGGLSNFSGDACASCLLKQNGGTFARSCCFGVT